MKKRYLFYWYLFYAVATCSFHQEHEEIVEWEKADKKKKQGMIVHIWRCLLPLAKARGLRIVYG